MPGGFQLGYGGANFASAGYNSASSAGTTITAGASANTKGAYAELISATLFDGVGILLCIENTSPIRAAIDLAIGPSGSEMIIVPDIFFTPNAPSSFSVTFAATIPLSVPAGTRIAARMQASAGGVTASVSAILFDRSNDGRQALGIAETYGFVSATTLGTQVNPGSTTNVYGSWTEITPSTTYDIRALSLGYRPGSTSATGSIQIGIGVSGSETQIIPDFLCGGSSDLFAALFEVDIPAGSRISSRLSSNTLSAEIYLTATGYG